MTDLMLSNDTLNRLRSASKRARNPGSRWLEKPDRHKQRNFNAVTEDGAVYRIYQRQNLDGEGIDMAGINLHFVDELIAVRRDQHGGGRGAPSLQGGHRIGASINRSCIVMLSALLQSYVEEVFGEAARRTFPRLNVDDAHYERYWNQMKGWGNPSGANVKSLFLKIGIPDVFDGLSWQGTTTERIRTRLDELNQIRNQIAHGKRDLSLSGNRYSLSLARVQTYRNFAKNFGERFSEHVDGMIGEA